MMNERTQDLIEQFATNLLNRSGYDMREYEPFLKEAEKFAELIAQHCVEVIDAAKAGYDQVPAEVALDMAAKNVKAYFGTKD